MKTGPSIKVGVAAEAQCLTDKYHVIYKEILNFR